jgi:PAS domain S-box-containing protein
MMTEDQQREQNALLQTSRLRRQAEEVLRTTGRDLQAMSVEDVQRLVYELQIHQIELEMQNEELHEMQYALAAARDRYSELYDFAPVGYLTLDARGMITEANLTACRLLGVDREFLVRERLSHFLAPESRDIFHRHHQAVRASSGTHRCELSLQRLNGQSLSVQLESVAARDELKGTLDCRTVLLDISERKKAEEGLRKAHDELEQRVKARTAALTAANERLTREVRVRQQTEERLRASGERYRTLAEQQEQQLILADRLVSFGELAASFAHEFNNPLAIIITLADALGAKVKPSHRHYRPLQIIADEARRCSRFVQDILGFARPVKSQLSPVSVAEVVRHSIQLISTHAYKQQVHPVFEVAQDLPLVFADPQQLEQVLLNLFFNALEAMPKGGTLTVRADTGTAQLDGGAPGDPVVRIAVTDTGTGIAPQVLSEIFRPFFTTKTKGGMGLGLSVCESVMKAHGGTIVVDSLPNHGATFTLVLPIGNTDALQP